MNMHHDIEQAHELVHVMQDDDVVFDVTHDTGSYVATHWHSAIEIIYILNGELEVVMDGQSVILCREDMLLLNSKILHSTKCTKENDAVLLQLPYPFLKKYIPDLDSLFFTLNTCRMAQEKRDKFLQIKSLLNRMRVLHESHPQGSKLIFTSLLFELLHLIHQDFRSQVLRSDYLKRTKHLARLEPLLQYAQLHYRENVAIDEIAAVAGFQPEYFCRFFKKNMGVTFLTYLNEVRLSYIYQDLILTELPVGQLLELHGFTNYKLFRRMFQEHFHNTPSGVRRKLKSE